MKKIKLILLLMMAMIAVSCSTEEKGLSPDKISVALMPASQPTVAAKDVVRGNIYAWVEDISVNATHNSTGYSVSETFSLVDNGTSGAESNFILDDVGLGQNTFTASTTTNGANELSYNVVADASDKDEVLEDFIDKNPYATYESSDVSANITNSAPNVVNSPMRTEHGRRISLFRLSNESAIQDNYYATVKSYRNGTEVGSGTVNDNGGVLVYWSNLEATVGRQIKHVIKLRFKSNGNIFKTFVIVEEIHASTSNSCTYTVISSSNVRKDEQELNFQWQVWTEGGCTDCPDED